MKYDSMPKGVMLTRRQFRRLRKHVRRDHGRGLLTAKKRDNIIAGLKQATR